MKTKTAFTRGSTPFFVPSIKMGMPFVPLPLADLWDFLPAGGWARGMYALVFIGIGCYILWARRQSREKLRQINEVTRKFVPGKFLRSIGREQITDVALGDYAKREVTVLFTDIRDYTSLSESMTPEENYQFINAYNGRMGPVIRRHRGFINQYLGDAIMAIFPESPADALHAAIAMQKLLQEYNKSRISKGRRPIRVGMGMHFGSLIMGIIGDSERMDTATISDTVNIASRIECLTKYFDANILLSEEALVQCRPPSKCGLHLRCLGRIQVKGKLTSIGLYECIDGDPPEVLACKLRALPYFEAGLHHFLTREFREAVAAFREVLKVCPGDQPAQLFLQHAELYLQDGVPDEWTGVETMDRK